MGQDRRNIFILVTSEEKRINTHAFPMQQEMEAKQMRNMIVGVLAIMFMFGCMTVSYGGGTADEAKVMVEKAVAYMKANGKETTLKEVSNKKGQFVKDDLYVYILDMSGTCIAHGANEKLIGGDLTKLRDFDGRYSIKDMVAEAGKKGTGWADYHWENPVSKTIDMKSVYFKKDGDLIYACGIYKK